MKKILLLTTLLFAILGRWGGHALGTDHDRIW